jgi:uncharacterized membrane protein
MKRRRLICLILIIIFASVGNFTAVHLSEIHYKKPGHQLNLINKLPLMERWFPRKEVEKAVEEEKKQEEIKKNDANPFDNPDFDPYKAAAQAKTSIAKNGGFKKQEACDISTGFSCTAVDDSGYSEVFGLGMGIYGIAGYSLLILLSLIHIIRKRAKSDVFAFMIFCGAWIGLFFSIYLTWLEAAKIHSFCPYCLVSAGAMFLVFICAIIGFGFEPVQMFFKGGIFPTSLLRPAAKKQAS